MATYWYIAVRDRRDLNTTPDMGRVIRDFGFCFDISNEAKIANDINVKVGQDYQSPVESIGVSLRGASEATYVKGALGNLESGSLIRGFYGVEL